MQLRLGVEPEPHRDGRLGLRDADAACRRKRHHGNVGDVSRKIRGDRRHDIESRLALRRVRKLVHLGRQHEHRAPAREVAREQAAVEVGEPMPRIDDQDEADQRLARREIAREKFLPVPLSSCGTAA